MKVLILKYYNYILINQLIYNVNMRHDIYAYANNKTKLISFLTNLQFEFSYFIIYERI